MILEIILFWILLFLLVKAYLVSSKPPGTPPGTNGLPIIGVFPPRHLTFEEFIQSYRDKYGDTFWLKMGSDNYIFICEYEDIVASFNNPALQGRPLSYGITLLYKYGYKDAEISKDPITEPILGIVNSEGEKWKNVRRFVIRRLRDGGMGKSSMEGIILREAEALVEDFEKHVGKPIEVPRSVNTSILNVVWGIIGDRRYDLFDEEIQNLCYYLTDLFDILQNRLKVFDFMTWLVRFTPEFMLNHFGKKEFDDKVRKIYARLHEAVDEHKKTLDEDNPRDLIDSYLIDLKALENDLPNKPDYCHTFSERELTQSLFDLFAAGSETTSSTIKWFIFFMAKYPEIQKRVHAEIDNAVSKDNLVTLAERHRLPYLECCINETLRLKSILPFGLLHKATEDTYISDYFVPKGTCVIANIISCHRSPRFWEKPNEFYPNHFLNNDGTFNSNKPGLVPFSTGRRVCLGENLARMDLYLILGALMQKFNITVPEGEAMSDEVCPTQPFFTLPKPFKIIINKR